MECRLCPSSSHQHNCTRIQGNQKLILQKYVICNARRKKQLNISLSRFIYHSQFQEPIGHDDFYLNGGETQPWCSPIYGAMCSTKISYDLLTAIFEVLPSHFDQIFLYLERIMTSCENLLLSCLSTKSVPFSTPIAQIVTTTRDYINQNARLASNATHYDFLMTLE